MHKEINLLTHTGVLGMRWGVRKGKLKAHFKRSIEQKYGPRIPKSQDHLAAKALKKKKLSQMSNDELKKLNTRLQLERQYKDLNKSNTSSGKKFISDVISSSGKTLASKYLVGFAESSIKMVSYAINPDLIPD